MASLTTPLKSIVYKALVAIAEKHTLTLQYEALLAGWPEDIATKLEVLPTPKGTLKVSYPKNLKNKILGFEYGGEDTPPSPVMRNYMTKIGVRVESSMGSGGPSSVARVSLAEMKALN